MICAYRTDDIRAAEEPLLAAGVPLMRHAARAVAYVVIRELKERHEQASGRRVVALVGSGNNGGDALYALTHLRTRGVHCTALLAFPDAAHSEGLQAARTAGVNIDEAAPDTVREQVGKADIVLDALLGIGARGALREPLAGIVATTNEAVATQKKRGANAPICIAVDIPTGISVDDGTLPGEAFRADVTVTMGAAKPGLFLDPARPYAGDVRVVDLNFPLPDEPALIALEDSDIAQLWRVPGVNSHKYARGVVGMMTGSPTYPGAAILSVGGALGAGAGMVRFAGPQRLARMVLGAHPEIVTTRGRVQAWVLGSGVDMDDEEAAAEVARRLHESMSENRPVVLDAGAISLAATTELRSCVVLTPHAGEAAQLLSALAETSTREAVEAAPARAARLIATLTGATVLLKGAIDVACAPDGPLYVATGAPAWRASAGAGDVLAGLLGSLLAMWGDELADLGDGHGIPVRLAAAAAYVHGRAAALASGVQPTPSGKTRGGKPISASDIAAAIPDAVRDILS
ncbi:MAG: NAD(P)H-hydrate epimerase [Actinomycetaceae bacterium]|nr:NAD(P)H-hydrate epimerase [Actinomycetaceae bacterium]